MDEQAWMETATGGEEEEFEMTDQQAIVNTYVTMMLQLIQMDPWISVPRVLEALVNPGPLRTREQIVEVFGGWLVFRRTLSRMEVVRGGTANGNLRNLPLTTKVPDREPFGYTIPGWGNFIAWWAPQTGEGVPPFLFSMRMTDRAHLQRYPHTGAYTEDYEGGGGSDTEGSAEGNL